MLITLNYQISATFHAILKICLRNFAKSRGNFNIKLVFNSLKIKKYFSYKDPFADDLKSFLLYKFTYASCSSGYIGETCCHLHSTTTCFDSYNCLSFKIIDRANSKLDSKITETLYINWRKPNLNA